MTRLVEYAIIDLHAGNVASVTGDGIMKLRKGDDLGNIMLNIVDCIDYASEHYMDYRASNNVECWLQCYASLALAVKLMDKTRPAGANLFDTDTSSDE